MFTKNTMPIRHSVVSYTTTYFIILVKVAGLPTTANPTPYEYKAGGYKFCLMDKNSAPTTRDLYPHFTNEQLAEVEDTFDQYIAMLLRVFDRLQESGQLTAILKELPCPTSDSTASNQTSQ
jgi:hypothetical protein